MSKRKPKPLSKPDQLEQTFIRGLIAINIVILLFAPGISLAETVDWSCQAHSRMVIQREFKACSDLVECELDAARLHSDKPKLYQMDGHQIWGIMYDTVIATSNLVDADHCK